MRKICTVCHTETDDPQIVREYSGNSCTHTLVCWDCWDARDKQQKICEKCRYYWPKTFYEGDCFKRANTVGSVDTCDKWELDVMKCRIEEETKECEKMSENESVSISGSKAENDPVNHPSHYCRNGIETIDVIEAWELDFNLGNCVKYISRHGHKDKTKEIEDLEKARFYLDREIKNLKKKSEKSE